MASTVKSDIHARRDLSVFESRLVGRIVILMKLVICYTLTVLHYICVLCYKEGDMSRYLTQRELELALFEIVNELENGEGKIKLSL